MKSPTQYKKTDKYGPKKVPLPQVNLNLGIFHVRLTSDEFISTDICVIIFLFIYRAQANQYFLSY